MYIHVHPLQELSGEDATDEEIREAVEEAHL